MSILFEADGVLATLLCCPNVGREVELGDGKVLAAPLTLKLSREVADGPRLVEPPNIGREVLLPAAVPFDAPRMLEPLREVADDPKPVELPNIGREVLLPTAAPFAVPRTLKSLIDDAAAPTLRRTAGLPSRNSPPKPS